MQGYKASLFQVQDPHSSILFFVCGPSLVSIVDLVEAIPPPRIRGPSCFVSLTNGEAPRGIVRLQWVGMGARFFRCAHGTA